MRTSTIVVLSFCLFAVFMVADRNPVVSSSSLDEVLPTGVLGRVDGVDITVEQYQQFLYRKSDVTRLMEFVDEVLTKKKAEGLGIEISTEELTEIVDRQIQGFIEQIHQGDRDQFVASLKRRSQTYESYRRWQMGLMHVRILRERCTRKLRDIGEDHIQEKFDEVYGRGGVHIQVRHIVVQKTTKGSDGVDRDPSAVAQQIVDELRQDPDRFEELVKKHSEDAMTRRNDGFIPNYKPTLFGAGFHSALESLSEDGQIAGPVESDRGIHVLQRVKRTVTKIDEVRSEIRSVLERQDPTPGEIARFLMKLREEARIEL